MRRRHLLASGSMLALAGCTYLREYGTDAEADRQSTDEDPTQSDPEESEHSDTTLEITAIDAPTTAGQTEQFDVDVTVDGNVASVVTATLLNTDGEPVAKNSAATAGSGDETSTIPLTVIDSVSTGESTIHVEAVAESLSDEATVSITITGITPEWEASFEAAVEDITAFLDGFAAVGSDAEDRTILDTTITDGYRGYAVNDYLVTAADHANDAYDETKSRGAVRTRMRRLREEVRLLESLNSCQHETCELFTTLEDELERFRNGAILSGEITAQYNTVQAALDELSGWVSSTEPVVGSNYDPKAAQIAGELEIVSRVTDAVTAVFIARNAFDAGNDDRAFDGARSARRAFEAVIQDLEREGTYPPEETVDQAYVAHVAEWETEAEAIEQDAAES